MGCRLVTLQEELESTKQQPEPMHLTERPSNEEEEKSRIDSEEPESEATVEFQSRNDVVHGPPLQIHSSSSRSDSPPTLTSQLSDIVDLCEAMKEQDVQDKTEAVLERILRAQYKVDALGDAASAQVVDQLNEIDARFQTFVGEYTPGNDSAAWGALRSFDADLEGVEAQLGYA